MEIKFGTDGWCGVIAREFTFANVRTAAQALGDFLKSAPQIPGPGGKPLPLNAQTKIVVGYDHRFQSEQFADAAARVLLAAGFHVTLSDGALPTPAVSFLTAKTDAKIGVVITASHNPPTWNGFKIKLAGRAAPEAVTAGVEAALGKGRPLSGDAAPKKSFREPYLAYLKSLYDTGAIARKLKKPVVVDYMYGAGCGLLAEVLPYKKLVSIRNHRDPLFGGVHPEPIEKYLGALSEAVIENKAGIGIALDGDADRLGLVDENGRYMTPCQVFPLIMEYVLATRKPKGKVVQSVSLGYMAKRIAAAHNMIFEEVPVGFKFVAERMLAEEVAFGGEESGGYSWTGLLPERDGLVSGLLFLEMLGTTGKTVGQLWEDIAKKYGESVFLRRDIRIAKPVEKKNFLDKLARQLPAKPAGLKIVSKTTLDGVKIYFEKDEWLLLRSSGTEPLIRAYAETDSRKKTEALLDAAEQAVRKLL